MGSEYECVVLVLVVVVYVQSQQFENKYMGSNEYGERVKRERMGFARISRIDNGIVRRFPQQQRR